MADGSDIYNPIVDLTRSNYLLNDLSNLSPTALTTIQNAALAVLSPVTAYKQVRVPEDYASLGLAVAAANASLFSGTGFMSISVAAGSCGTPNNPIPGVEITHSEGSKRIEIVGRTGNPNDTVMYFDMTNNGVGILVRGGAGIYNLANFKIEGVGGYQSFGVWANATFGGGIIASNGGEIFLINNVLVDRCYYPIRAFNYSYVYVTASCKVTNGGDVGIQSYGCSEVYCEPGVEASFCAHTAQGLGAGFGAEASSFLYAQGVNSHDNGQSGYAILTSSAAWIQGAQGNTNQYGIVVAESSSCEAGPNGTTKTSFSGNAINNVKVTNGSSFNGNSVLTNFAAQGVTGPTFPQGVSIYVTGGSYADLTAASTSNAKLDSHVADRGSTITGDSQNSYNAGRYGYLADLNGTIAGKSMVSNVSGQEAFYAKRGGQISCPSFGANGFGSPTGSTPAVGVLGPSGGYIDNNA